MPGGGQSRGPKRKRNRDAEYPSFPGESPLPCRQAGLRTVGTVASLSEAWLRCGEGFLKSPGTPSLTAEKKTTTEKHLELSCRPKKEPTTSKNTSGLAAITWSSSGSDLSDEDKTAFKSQRDNGYHSRTDRCCNSNILCPEDGASEDDLQVIDWEIDSEREDACECDEFEECESVVEISDCASGASSRSLTPAETPPELPKTNRTEILEYSSDSEEDDGSENVLLIDSESSHKYHMDFGSDGRQGTERRKNLRVESTETILQTPKKQTKLPKTPETILQTPKKQTKLPKTPESSAKRKKLLRGGLAERLNGLQNRERSTISLWRHQGLSYQKTLSGIKSGVLTVKILELHEECTVHVATCRQLSEPQADGPSQGGATGASLKVLFTKETAHCLRGRPQDVVHIYPPWQKLIIPGGSCPVILNTYFCQKVVAKEDSEASRDGHEYYTPCPRRSSTLAQMFQFKSLTDSSPESKVLCDSHTAVGTDRTLHPEQVEPCVPSQAPLRDSLLDAVESHGAATWTGVGVRVVVQRVYSLPCRGQQADSTDPTRARMAELFSLIDTMWPPRAALKATGPGTAFEEKTHLPPPSFCYILSAHPDVGQIDVIEDDPVAELYQPPTPRFLKEILQTDGLCTHCSFCARVIYRRPQANSLFLEPREMWLVVTDITLQTLDEDSSLPRTVPVRVAASCLLDQEVRDALCKATSQSFLFRDALRDQGQIVCVGRTVLLPLKPREGVTVGAWELTGPLRLDELGPGTRVNSICSIQGTVVAVDESTACSWPVCDLCGSERLERSLADSSGTFSCGDCSHVVTMPILRRHLQVFLDSPSRPRCTVRVKLLQDSISSLLRFAACEDGSYEVRSVLGKEVGPLTCFVQCITTHPTSSVGLEEVELLSEGRAS
ncbi:DNA repair-scaffolding protein isoform X2 [Bubalus kerabau]|uniref:DNA repair-scaffolding protein isoform X2 n=1 Tax=Bubalus carabanensis TaxID=3119969 RepID=UPI00244E8669|nr:DNA repair-scaffolding protein isoform X2 [Bubalus carabanensis]